MKGGFRPNDILIGVILFAAAAAYALGFGLDWSKRAAKPEVPENVEIAQAAKEARSETALAPSEAGRANPPRQVPRIPAWAPDPAEKSWEKMTESLFRLAASHKGRVAIVLKDLSSGRTWTYHQDDLFPAASLIKVPVMISVFTKIHEGRLSWSQKVALRRRHRTGGSGSVKWRHDGTRIRVRELLYRMINESDNTATAMLIDTVGLGYIQQLLPKLGLFYTEVNQEGLDLKSGRVPRENYTTAREMTMLMERIYRGEVVSRASSELMMDILKHRRARRSRLAKNLPRKWDMAHKTGLLRRACHDVAIIMTPHGDYIMAVLTGQNRSYHSAKNFIARLGKVTFKHYGRVHLLADGSSRKKRAVR